MKVPIIIPIHYNFSIIERNLCTSVNCIATNYLLSDDDISPGPSKRRKLSTTTPGLTSELANR